MNSTFAVILGIAAGVLSGIIGIGGGVLIVPALVYVLKFSQLRAQGTSLAALLAPVGVFALVQYRKASAVDSHIAVLIALGFLFGGWFGGDIARHLPEAVLRRSFGAVLLILSLRMLF